MAATGPANQMDQARADAFAERMLDVLNHGALSLMLSIGHRTGLLDTMRGRPPGTAQAIADAAHLDERYVREWLGALCTAGIVEVDGNAALYHLPDAHAGVLTRAAGADNVAVFMQYIAVLGMVEDAIVDCFRHGGGLPYARYPRFHEVMAEDSGLSVLSSLQDHVLPLVPGLQQRLQAGIDVLDLGCGRGCIMHRLASLYPASRFTGMDLCGEAIAHARSQAVANHLPTLQFRVQDLSDFDSTAPADAFDFVTTFDAIHDQAKPLAVLRGIQRTLRADGIYLMQDIAGSSDIHTDLDHPIGTFLYTISCMHCMSVSLAQGGDGLGAMWGERVARRYLSDAGFGTVTTHRLAHDIQNNWYVVQQPQAMHVHDNSNPPTS